MMTVEGNLDAAGGPIGMFPDLPWTPEAGFEVERPPAQLDDPVARTLANLAAQRARADGVRATEADDPA